MKEDELRDNAICNLCGQPIGKSGLPLFWRVTVERFGLNLTALQRQQGLAMILGSASLARVMGADEDLAISMMEPAKITVCESCCTNEICVAQLAEANNANTL